MQLQPPQTTFRAFCLHSNFGDTYGIPALVMPKQHASNQTGSKPRLNNEQEPSSVEESKCRPCSQGKFPRLRPAPQTLRLFLTTGLTVKSDVPISWFLKRRQGQHLLNGFFSRQFIIIIYLCHKTSLPLFHQMHELYFIIKFSHTMHSINKRLSNTTFLASM